jgi:hypothetical protein
MKSPIKLGFPKPFFSAEIHSDYTASTWPESPLSRPAQRKLRCRVSPDKGLATI